MIITKTILIKRPATALPMTTENEKNKKIINYFLSIIMNLLEQFGGQSHFK